jgi:phosphoglycolate phosphatase
VIFDLDGTLVDSLDDIAGALGRAMTDAGLPAPGRDAVRGWIGGGARNLVAQALSPDGADRVDEVLAGFRRHYDAAPVAHTRLFDGIAGALDHLAGRVTLAILSNKPHELTVAIAHALLGRWPFAAVVGARAGVAHKPDPASALALSRALDIAPADCAFVGDAGTDVATARAAGMRPIGVTWGFRPRSELIDAGADAIVDDPAELSSLA